MQHADQPGGRGGDELCVDGTGHRFGPAAALGVLASCAGGGGVIAAGRVASPPATGGARRGYIWISLKNRRSSGAKIGRASCRERVGEDLKNPEGAVDLTKKK